MAIRLAAPPVDGAANEALCKFLAQQLGMSRSQVSIESGAAARIKQIRLSGDSPSIADRLAKAAGSA